MSRCRKLILNMTDQTVSEVGEKALIAKLIRPLFDGGEPSPTIGNDCAILASHAEHDLLLSTDRVPADLIAFRLGILDHFGLGRYLAFLNISDIAACGGEPAALLLNMGIPAQLPVSDFDAICRGVHEVVLHFGCRVVGGDISSSTELSLSATSVGFVPKGRALTRSGARPGDKVFITRELGLTPAAFGYFLSQECRLELSEADVERLKRQFTDIVPLVDVGRWLRNSGRCTACMDNTDGVAQSFSEIGAESGVAIVLERELFSVPELVTSIAVASGVDPLNLALGPGADLSLVGTLASDCEPPANVEPSARIRVVGRVEEGRGVHLADGSGRHPFAIKGWDYFVGEISRR